MKVLKRLCVMPLLMASALFIFTDSSDLSAEEPSLQKQVDQLAQPYIDNDIVVGMSIGLLSKGNAETFGYGCTEKNGSQIPNAETVYEIGSLSKVFTSILLADAVVQGRVRLDQPAAELLPSAVSMPTFGERVITLKDLSIHISGLPVLPDNIHYKSIENPYADYTIEEFYAFLNDYKLSRSPGEQWEYSNAAYGLLGHLLELEAQSNYEKLLLNRITQPLEMSSTTITLSSEQQSRLAAPHLVNGQRTQNWDFPTLAAAGAIRGSVNDLLRFAAANLNPPQGPLGDALQMAWKRHHEPLREGEFAMGLGWMIAHDEQTRWHNGQTGGYHSILYINREIPAAVVILSNTASGEVDLLGQDIIQMLAGDKVEPRTFSKAVSPTSDDSQD